MPSTYSAEYIAGIQEGRQLKRLTNPDLAMMREFHASCVATMREFSAGPVKDLLKGERDFWQNQIKIEMLRQACCLEVKGE
jgi:hypothetical protein